MGVDLALVRFFDHCAAVAPIGGPMLALGSLSLREPDVDLVAFARANNYRRLAINKDVAALMADRYGVEEYLSCDINDQADIVLDLAEPLPVDHRGAYASILNGGTLEHVLDVRQALQNVHDAVRPGGLMLHTTPLTWFDHGFFNFNPVLFRMLAEANAYDIVAEGYYFCAGTWAGQTKPVVVLEGVDDIVPGLGQPYREVFAGSALPALAMHLAALRKKLDAPFKTPTQRAD